MKFASRIIYGLLPMLAAAAVAQPAKQAVDPVKTEARDPTRGADVQQRRATLRESLKSQPEVAVTRDAPTNSVRLLSAQERADLRQQLRQQ